MITYKGTDIPIQIGDIVISMSIAEKVVIGIENNFVTLRYIHHPHGEFDHLTRHENLKFITRPAYPDQSK
jgi:hypothetical protein